MKILMSSINPLFADQVIGGSTKHLQKVAIHLGNLGHEVTILSTKRPDTDTPFHWHPNVQIKPVMRFKQPFPQPYEIPAHMMASNIQTVFDHLDSADTFYVHDGEWLFTESHMHQPTVISLRDNVYPETMLGMFLFKGDGLIPISDYSEQVIRHTAGRFYPGLDERIRTVPNALDWGRFKPQPLTGKEEIFQIISIDPKAHAIVLHPHRPEPSKGLLDTVKVVDQLVHKHGIDHVLTLVPHWFDADVSPDVRQYLNVVQNEIKQRDLEKHFYFHGWLPQRLMQEYFNLGDVMLSLGHFVEAFGNTVYESLGCGTPSIAARIATHRTLVPDGLLDKVHHGDVDSAAEIAARIIKNRESTSAETMAYLHETYNEEKQLAGYSEMILGATKLPTLEFVSSPITGETRLVLPPWCYIWGDQVYHDFKAQHTQLPNLVSLLNEQPAGFTRPMAAHVGIGPEVINHWIEEGFVVPALKS